MSEFSTQRQEPCDDWYDVPSDEMTLEQARQAVRDLRKKLSEQIEQEPILDKIRADIIAEFSHNIYAVEHGYLDQMLEIIDKHKAESEDKECI